MHDEKNWIIRLSASGHLTMLQLRNTLTKKPSTLDDASHRLLECSVNCDEHLQGGILQAVIENRAVLGVLGYIFCNTTLCKLEVGAEGRKERVVV